jgi:membrane-bound lytic murein transglycosylase D
MEPLRPISMATLASQKVANLSPPADLWERIRRGFQMTDLESELVREREQWYATRPDYMQRMTERSRKYLFHIVEELERRNLPSELALLPFIESAFNPQAVSTAKAAGMWQFIPSTGKYFDLKQNAFRDDRRDVLASTRAALDYLQKLHGMFGDWHLALAAYNWGEGSVARAIARNKRAGLGTAYPDLGMPMETRLYVPKLQAVKNIVASPERFGSRLPVIENHPYFQTVDITRDIDVAVAAQLAEVKLDDFRELNPSLSRPVILAAGTPQILLPWDNAALFQRNLETWSGGQLANWTAWIVPSTMRPAEAARRTGMKEVDLRTVNQIPAGMSIRAGSTLLVPRTGQVSTDVAGHVADNGQLALVREQAARRTVVRAGKQDSVASVARRYGVSASSVAEWNSVAVTAALAAGQQVVLFLPARTGKPMAGSSRTKGTIKPRMRPAARKK